MNNSALQKRPALNELVIKISTDPSEILAYQGLVWQKYCNELNWFDPEDFPNQVMADRYDKHSAFILVHKEDKIVGGTRLVKDSSLGFPHERFLGFSLPNSSEQTDAEVRAKLMDVGREKIMEITKTISVSKKNMLTADLVKAYYWYGLSNDISAYFMVIDMPFFLLCDKLKIPLQPISVAGFIDGSWTIPCVLFVDEIKSGLEKNNPPFWDYIRDKGNLAGNWFVHSQE